MKEWSVIAAIISISVFIIMAMSLTERQSLTLAQALIVLNCGEAPNQYYIAETNECAYTFCRYKFTAEEQRNLSCRKYGKNITEEYLYSQADKGDLA